MCALVAGRAGHIAASSPSRQRPTAALRVTPGPASGHLRTRRAQDGRWVPASSCRRTAGATAAAVKVAATGAAAEQRAPGPEPPQADTPVQSFLRWLIANGVEGIGVAGSKVALFEGTAGERGVLALTPIEEGDVIMRIPLRLAITDQQDEEEAEEGAAGAAAMDWEDLQQPWSIQLAGKLLGMVQRGGSCPWHAYLQVLPQAVPSPLTAFSWEDVQAVEYQPMRRQLDHATWLASVASQKLQERTADAGSGSSSSGGGFTREQWEWALSVVHSRTFGTPGKSGGVGVRMLVPLIDMLNHAGDYTTSPPGASSPAVQAFDNVRWDLQAPSMDSSGSSGGSSSSEWYMVVRATKDIDAGEEVLLSYGERSNDDFCLFYGFCPPRNPHDDVALFTDIESGIDWWLNAFAPPGTLTPQQLRGAINSAYTAAEAEDNGGTAAEAILAAVPEAEAEVMRAGLAKIKLSAGGMVDGRLLAAYRSLYEAAAAAAAAAAAGAGAQQQDSSGSSGTGSSSTPLGGSWADHLRQAVALRCRQLLLGMPTPLLADLQQLAAWEQQSGEQGHRWAAQQQHYAAAVAAYQAVHGSMQQGDAGAGDAAAAAGEAAGEISTGISSSGGAPLLDAGAAAGEDAALAQLLLQQGRLLQAADSEQQQAEDDGGPSSSSSDGSSSSILPIMYRAYKKMIVWDAILLSSG